MGLCKIFQSKSSNKISPVSEINENKDRQELRFRGNKLTLVPCTNTDGIRFERYLLTPDKNSYEKAEESISVEDIRSWIEPWLTALCQAEHLSLLVGSGMTHAIHAIATGDSLPGMGKLSWGSNDGIIQDASLESAKKMGRNEGNLEDQIRVANELLRGFSILAKGDKSYEERKDELEEILDQNLKHFAQSILKGENNLIVADEKERQKAFSYLISFLMSFSSRTGTRERLQIFTINYDRVIEAGADVAGLRLIDRFVGALSPIFRSSRLDIDMHYDPPGIRGEPRYLEGVAKFTKLHGSLDWIQSGEDIRRVGLPFGATSIDPYLQVPEAGSTLPLMIYPNSTKDHETALFPYVELFRDFAAATCRPNNVLFTYGYSFGDDHINRVIEDMLTIPSTHLVIISYGDSLGRITSFYEKLGRSSQITVLLGNHLGNLECLVDNYLPKPAIDQASFRMSQLLKNRWGQKQAVPPDDVEEEKS